jgi:hypothetical protein
MERKEFDLRFSVAVVRLQRCELQRPRWGECIVLPSFVRHSGPNRARHGDRIEPQRIGRRNLVCDSGGRFDDECTSSAATDASDISVPDLAAHDHRNGAARSDLERLDRLLERDDPAQLRVSVAAL